MIDRIEELFESELERGRLEFSRAPDADPRERALAACYNRIHAALGLEFLDRLNDLEAEAAYYERLICFRHGFRLALRLVLEAGV
ncbi:DUF6809 family protein [Pseudoflavonifractor capillosus]|uniref:Uncharacterized protein n=1 Tax=Pseudoflavonifractor capillosus TaxID=106588 RepID=A0A921ST55_9FIRM|nr:DUF6809 family protein [Pseudoflavonifractor capillosus]HJG87545.1 hypothetical protein [Pseudoflavonifractor capillosus]